MATDAKIDALIASLEELIRESREDRASRRDDRGRDRGGDRGRSRVTAREGEEMTDVYRREQDALFNKIELLEKELEFRGKLSKQKQLQMDQMKAEEQLLVKLAGASDPEERDRIIKQLEDLKDAHEDFNDELGIGKKKSEELTQSILGINGEADKFARIMPTSTVELAGFVTKTIASVKSGQIFVRVLNKLVAEGFNLSMALDKVNASLARTNALFQETGTIMDQQARIIRGVESSNRILGVTADEAGQAMGALQSSMADFTRMSKSDQESILNTATVMQELGVSAQTSAQIFDKATKSLGYQNSEIRGIADELHATAQSLGVPFSQIADDFNMVATELAFYGESAIDVFKDLAKQSKATGLSMQQLLKIGGQAFNTFDGAAQKVGRLNAILGGPYLNSIDMLNASEAERIDLIKQSMDASGQMFSDLSKYEQMAIADALGVSTEEARRLFGELSAAEEMDIRQKEKMEETARKAQATMDKLTNAFMSLVVSLDPVVGRISKVIEGLSKYIDENGKAIKIILYTVSIVGTLITKFIAFSKFGSLGGKVLKFLAKGMLKFAGYVASAVAIFNGLIEAINAFFKVSEAGGGIGDYLGGMLLGFGKGIAEVVDFLTGGFLTFLSDVTDIFDIGLDFKEAFEMLDFSFIGETISYIVKEALKNLTFGGFSLGAIGSALGFGEGGTINTPKNPTKVNDMILTSDGEVIQPNRQDTIFAAKPGGPIMNAMSPILNLLGGGGTNNNIINNNNTVDQQPSNVNVIVKVGERELRDIFIDVLRDTTASSEISGFGGR